MVTEYPKEKRTGWVNVYLEEYCRDEVWGFIYTTKHEANAAASTDRIACIPFTEGEGL